nr:MAG TPA: hypothetical protein [Caudoviricetes sp.]
MSQFFFFCARGRFNTRRLLQWKIRKLFSYQAEARQL